MIGIIGGSGFYELLQKAKMLDLDTPYGKPSSGMTFGSIGDKEVVFVARHGPGHKLPPHKIPYKANLYALYGMGVRHVISASAVGSLKPEIKPGDFVVPDQLVNLTSGRDDTYYHGDENSVEDCVIHLGFADPFCENMRKKLIGQAKLLGNRTHGKGTAVVINGPRFSTKAESLMFRNHGWDIINMTMYPEAVLARELQMCYANISLITDYDTGVKDNPNAESVNIDEVLRVFKENSEKLKKIIEEVIDKIEDEKECSCHKSLENARLG